MTEQTFVPGDPRGFAALEPAAHEQGDTIALLDGTVTVEHRFTVPVDHSQTLAEAREHTADGTGPGPGGAGTLTVFAREFRASDSAEDATKPWLLYLQGGPGSGGTRPARLGGWMKEACRTHRVLMLDQRGTGASTPATVASLSALSPQAQADYLVHLRAPGIVRDAEMMRLALGVERWTTLGQSFGGFCTLSYLSWYPESLERSLVTGGLAPVTGHADRVYRATYARMRARAEEFFGRVPQAEDGWKRIVALLRSRAAAGEPEMLPDGSELTVARAQMLGMYLGGNTRLDTLVYLLTEGLDTTGGTPCLSEAFRAAVAGMVERRTHPLYTVLHEAIYAQPDAVSEATGSAATDWAAARVLAEHPDFDPEATAAENAAPVPTGEHVFAWQVAADSDLAPLAEATQILAAKQDWGPLYDVEALAENTVPVAAAVYTDDVYVDRDLSLETAEAVQGLKVKEYDEFHHDGIGDEGARILRELLELAGGSPAPNDDPTDTTS
ncbi:alpha/beta fold hydrolase, partial [Micrococcus lylae]|uniref:alpha/beta fold hydrolase n=1 Tax=Micrococcus lylae TaxID=1273 RepID=UPI003EC074A8